MVPQNAQIWPNLDFAAGTPNIAQITCLCQILGYLGDFMTIFDPILAYFGVRKWPFSRASGPATRDILKIFGRDEQGWNFFFSCHSQI